MTALYAYKIKVRHGQLQDDDKRIVVLRRLKKAGCLHHLDDTELHVVWFPHCQLNHDDVAIWIDLLGMLIVDRRDCCELFG